MIRHRLLPAGIVAALLGASLIVTVILRQPKIAKWLKPPQANLPEDSEIEMMRAALYDPTAFTWTVAARPAPVLRLGRGDTAVLYFNFATLTTLGYGDIVPTAPLSRILASVEAIAGQLYLAVLVARLVGRHIAHSIEQGPGTEGGRHTDGETGARAGGLSPE
jgi:hypothetical protein